MKFIHFLVSSLIFIVSGFLFMGIRVPINVQYSPYAKLIFNSVCAASFSTGIILLVFIFKKLSLKKLLLSAGIIISTGLLLMNILLSIFPYIYIITAICSGIGMGFFYTIVIYIMFNHVKKNIGLMVGMLSMSLCSGILLSYLANQHQWKLSHLWVLSLTIIGLIFTLIISFINLYNVTDNNRFKWEKWREKREHNISITTSIEVFFVIFFSFICLQSIRLHMVYESAHNFTNFEIVTIALVSSLIGRGLLGIFINYYNVERTFYLMFFVHSIPFVLFFLVQANEISLYIFLSLAWLTYGAFKTAFPLIALGNFDIDNFPINFAKVYCLYGFARLAAIFVIIYAREVQVAGTVYMISTWSLSGLSIWVLIKLIKMGIFSRRDPTIKQLLR